MFIGHQVQMLPLPLYSIPEVDPVGRVEARGAEQVPDAAEPVKEPESCPITLLSPEERSAEPCCHPFSSQLPFITHLIVRTYHEESTPTTHQRN